MVRHASGISQARVKTKCRIVADICLPCGEKGPIESRHDFPYVEQANMWKRAMDKGQAARDKDIVFLTSGRSSHASRSGSRQTSGFSDFRVIGGTGTLGEFRQG